jgi:hypothetical protein
MLESAGSHVGLCLDKTPTTIDFVSKLPTIVYVWTNGAPSSEVQGETGMSAGKITKLRIKKKILSKTYNQPEYISFNRFKIFEP